jgi:tetratricopeptide (TPR) repeat protein
MYYMTDFIPILVIIIIIGISFILFLFISRGKKKNTKGKPKTKDRNAIVKEANRRLAQNPKDPGALLSLAELYFEDGKFEKAKKTYALLIDLVATNPDLDEFDITLKHALSAMKVKDYDAAYKSLVIARSLKQDSFEVNYNLGYIEYLRKNYEKAAALLRAAKSTHEEDPQTQRYLGLSLFKIKKYKEAASLLKKVLDLEPDDKEALFALAQCYNELGQNDQATKIFTHLRTDPNLGPLAALYSGTIHLNNKNYEQAIMDFEIGLRHEKIKKGTTLELKYRLAAAYIKQQEIGKAVEQLNEIQNSSPGYKDVPDLIKKYGELNSNQNLQTYLISPPSEFAALCRKLVEAFFPKAKVKITDISMHKSEYADILAEVHTVKWEDTILFRFLRTTGKIGELMLRDLYSRVKDVKAGRGFCVTAGDYTEGAQQFVEARLIDLIDKKELMKKLNNVSRSRIQS